ncbi:hypothetical protein [Nonomuraea rubra]|uniref:Glycosyltransferase RgtA/B/C/D-like domain-containing protein n=1 Tax=Nonomuraea rubra TaxID=46180 RepID=A0A7X0P0A9_9ACTN|nr:hypothetical protein [Nonomuraea rubra]MBB6552911.1 hypothetical protein [Nonomuraea rubra]
MTTAFILSTPARPVPPVRRRGAGPRLRWLLVLGWIAQVALRLWLNRYHTTPVANPDETGYLLAARWLAGGAGADLSGSTFYQAGYALLLVPIFWLTSDPWLAYRLAVGVGAVAAASAYPVAYVLLRRLGVSGRAALVLAFVAGLSPALVVFSGYALADAVLPVVVLGWLVALHDLVADGPGRRRVLAGLGAGGLAAYAMAVHLRGTVIVAVCLLVAVTLWRRLPRAALLAILASAVAGAVAGDVLNRALRAALYPGGPRDLSGLLVERLTSLEGQAWALSGAAGQLWYLIAGTWGLAGVGMAGAVTLLARRRAPLAPRVLAGALLLLTLGIAYASSAALPDEHRVGNFAYGRYLACVAVAWTLAGLLTLLRARRLPAGPARPAPTGIGLPAPAAGRRAGWRGLGRPAAAGGRWGGPLRVVWLVVVAAGLLAVTGGVTAWYAGDRLRRHAFIAFDFPEVIFLTRTPGSLDLVAASLSALALLACLAGATLVRRPGMLAVGVLALVQVAFVAHLAPAPPAPGPDWLPAPSPPGRVAVEEGVKWNVWVPLSYRVWWTRIERFRGTPPEGVCTAVVPQDAGPPPAGWTTTGARHGWATWSRC